MRILVFNSILTTLLAAFCFNAPEVNGQNFGVLRGTVKLRDKPSAGVLVIVRSAGGQKTAVSGISGEYEISNLSPGTYLVTVGNTPYILSEGIGGSFIQLEIKASSVTSADLALTEGAVLTGCVEYPSKTPAIEREVIYENVDLPFNGFSLMNFRQTVLTNDLGCFRLYGLPAGHYRVGIGKPTNILSMNLSAPFSLTYYPGVQQRTEAKMIEVTSGHEHDLGKLVLGGQVPDAVVKGEFVNSASSDRVAQLSFELVRYDESGIRSVVRLMSDESGQFRLENQSPGQYRIQPALDPGRNPPFTFRSISFELREAKEHALTISCTSLTATIRGEVRINNEPAATAKDCSIALKEGEGLSPSFGDIHRITLKGGKFDLSGIPRGVYTLVVMPLRPNIQFERAQVGPQILRGSMGPVGLVSIDLTGGEQIVSIFLSEAPGPKP